MKMIDNSNEERERIPRRDFLRGVILAAGVAGVSSSVHGQTNKTMANKYALYGKLQAQSGKGKIHQS